MKVSYEFVMIYMQKIGFGNLNKSVLLRDRFLKFKIFCMKNVCLGKGTAWMKKIF